MNLDPSPGDDQKKAAVPLLEGITAAALILVMASLAWLILAAYLPAWGQWATTEVQVALLLALLAAALLLVSLVALLHTR